MTLANSPDPTTQITLHSVVLGGADHTPLLMLHGWGKNISTMAPLAQKLSTIRKVHIVDLPGFGETPWSGEDWSTFEYARCVIEYLDSKGINNVSLLGHSFGGRICLQLAKHWPDRIKQIILIGAAGLPPQRSLSNRLRLKVIKLLDKVAAHAPGGAGEYLQNWHRSRFGSPDYINAGALRNTLVKVVTEDQTKNAEEIPHPTLLIWGEEDFESPVEMGERFHRLIKNSSLIVLPHRGHIPFEGNGVFLCAEIINEFMGGKERRATS